MQCIVCHNKDIVPKLTLKTYQIFKCLNCTHQFTHNPHEEVDVKKIFSDDYFYQGRDGYSNYLIESDILIKRGEYYAKKLKQVSSVGKILDVGSASGFILKGFINSGWKGKGIELNENMAKYGNERLGLDIISGSLETIDLDEKFDAILLIQVIAHLYDLDKSFNKICNLLKPGGIILIETWNSDSLTAKLLGKNWHEYNPLTTFNYFSKKSLNIYLTHLGFSLIKKGRPKKMIHSEHARSILNYKFSESKSFNWLTGIEKIIPENIKIPYPAEDLFYAIYQKK